MRTREEIESIQKVISCKRGRYPDLSSAQTIELVLEVLLDIRELLTNNANKENK